MMSLGLCSQAIVSLICACPSDVLQDANALTVMKLALSMGTFTGIARNQVGVTYLIVVSTTV
jgi:hypothetical protein